MIYNYLTLNVYYLAVIRHLKAFRQQVTDLIMQADMVARVHEISVAGTDTARKTYCIVNQLV